MTQTAAIQLLLHLDLKHTTLEDFTEHVRISLGYGRLLMNIPEGTLEGVLGNDIPHAWYFEQSGQEPVIVLQESEISPAHRVFTVRYVHQFRRQETLSLHLKRYRTDFLRILLYLELDHAELDRDTATFSKKALLDWLRPRWGDGVIELPLENAPEEKLSQSRNRPAVHNGNNELTTLAHYLITKQKLSQVVACDLVTISVRTYRDHLKKNKLLSEQEYRNKTGKDIKVAAEAAIWGRHPE